MLPWPQSKLELAPERPPLRSSRESKDGESNELVSKGLHWLVFRTEEGGVELAARSKSSMNIYFFEIVKKIIYF